MATPSEKLAQSLDVLRELQKSKGNGAIRAKDITRTHLQRLINNGFIREVIKGWYIPIRPDEANGDTTGWYASYWSFISSYLEERLKSEWCLSPEQSLAINTGNWMAPKQILVFGPRAHNNRTDLPHNMSILEVKKELQLKDIEKKEGVRVLKLTKAVIDCSEAYFLRNPIEARAALSMFRDASELLERLLEGGHSVVAGRLAGAFRNIGRDQIADDILGAMRSAGYDVRENDPFAAKLAFGISAREVSPYVNRIRLMWAAMREHVLENFPKPIGAPKNIENYIRRVEDIYVTDAYHSLSIEGYQVTPELIKRVQSGNWRPDTIKEDLDHKNALAARGYWQAFQAVKSSIKKIIGGANAGKTIYEDHSAWYRELFAPSITAGLLRPSDLAGYRTGQVFIRGSRHTPLNPEAVREAMPVFFDLLTEETEPAARVVLGHFIFVYIHPYMDGNGRMGRFLMNALLASGGYPWIVIPVESRDVYMAALEKASVEKDIRPFARFIAKQLEKNNRLKAEA